MAQNEPRKNRLSRWEEVGQRERQADYPWYLAMGIVALAIGTSPWWMPWAFGVR